MTNNVLVKPDVALHIKELSLSLLHRQSYSVLIKQGYIFGRSHLFSAGVSSVPWYSSGLFLLAPKILMVGKPLTPY